MENRPCLCKELIKTNEKRHSVRGRVVEKEEANTVK